ncbi:hypothetical protein HYH03_010227 [Edaphochlamys debaryana]|uniref:Uncharacterized protein n=1 Tax=Edaphochlamys debaryana TaxID=47281 RepID=A0A836BW77_9CHLO|nr:hypothetical protein HYH03_010227 [Edaphochlamys debaryana]|eukprot:KAG2491441.1 hypothetical protein HYH03_010227 [Edaphochlamys debaryana]
MRLQLLLQRGSTLALPTAPGVLLTSGATDTGRCPSSSSAAAAAPKARGPPPAMLKALEEQRRIMRERQAAAQAQLAAAAAAGPKAGPGAPSPSPSAGPAPGQGPTAQGPPPPGTWQGVVPNQGPRQAGPMPSAVGPVGPQPVGPPPSVMAPGPGPGPRAPPQPGSPAAWPAQSASPPPPGVLPAALRSGAGPPAASGPPHGVASVPPPGPSPPPAARRAAPAPSSGMPLPDLLPGLSKKGRTARKTVSSGGATTVVGSTRSRRDGSDSGSDSDDGAGGLVVGSTRTAKAAFIDGPAPLLESRKQRRGNQSGQGQELQASTSYGGGLFVPPASPQYGGGYGSGSTAAAADTAGAASTGGIFAAGFGVAPSPPPRRAIPSYPPATSPTASAMAASGGNTTGEAEAAAPAAAAAPPAAAKKVARKPTWLTSFVKAKMAVSGGGGGAAAAAAEAEVAPKGPSVDMQAQAEAMVQAAAAQPASELGSAVTDLVVPLPQWAKRLEDGVRAEQAAEAAALRALYTGGSLRRLQREGVVLTGLTAVPAGRLYRSVLWRFSVRSGGSLPYHKFRPGGSVILTPFGPGGESASRPGPGGGGRGRDGRGDGGEAESDSLLPESGVEAVVTEAARDHLTLALDVRAHETFQSMVDAEGGGAASPAWRLDQWVRDTTTRRHLDALRRLAKWAEQVGPSRLGEARVRAVLAGSRSAPVLAAMPPEWVAEAAWRDDARAALGAFPGLNPSQRRAVAAALSRTVTLWQGPPGTGKTRTLMALIEVLVRVRNADPALPKARAGAFPASGSTTAAAAGGRFAAMGPVLAVADTNAAVDNIVEGLAGRGIKCVRLGPAAKARDAVRHLTLEAQSESTRAGKKAVALRAAALEKQDRWRSAAGGGGGGYNGRNGNRNGGGNGRDGAGAAAAALQEARRELEQAEAALREAAVGVLAAAEVVVCTCTTAGDMLLEGRPWRCVVVDEASQATEPSALVALTRGAAFAVLAGDPRQLPPTVISEEAVAAGLNVTLFERLEKEAGVLPLLLDTQYRMHPGIAEFPSAFFYGGRLKDGVEAADKPPPKGFPWPNSSKPLAVVQVTGSREETSGNTFEVPASLAASPPSPTLTPRGAKPSAKPDKGSDPGSGSGSAERSSYRNPAEALAALAITNQLLAAGDVSSAAILTPYRGQVRLVEALARQKGLEAAWAAQGLSVEVATVDGYQGREADVVVFSAVRSNDRGAVGFLSDSRRMNVAITRPRRGLVVLADGPTLTRGSRDWATYLKWARSQGAMVQDGDVMDLQRALAPGPGPGLGPRASPDLAGGWSDEDSDEDSDEEEGGASGSGGARKGAAALKRGGKALTGAASGVKSRGDSEEDEAEEQEEAPTLKPRAARGRSAAAVAAAAAARAAAEALESSELEEEEERALQAGARAGRGKAGARKRSTSSAGVGRTATG